MSDKRRGLGRGLGALIPSSAAAKPPATVQRRPVPWISSFPKPEKRTPAPRSLPDEPRQSRGARQPQTSESLASLLAAGCPQFRRLRTPKTAAAGQEGTAPGRPGPEGCRPAAAKSAAGTPADEQLAVDSVLSG